MKPSLLPIPTLLLATTLREFLPLGQRIEAVALDQWKDGNWTEITTRLVLRQCNYVT